MKYTIPLTALPANLIISYVLTEDEQPKVFMKAIPLKQPKKDKAKAAFHEKSAKNSKVNYIVKHKDRMMAKYGRPLKRGAKKKK